MKIAIAIIRDEQSRILITQRPLHVPCGGFWEFPGGKLEQGESAQQALKREIKEELGLVITEYQLLGEMPYQFDDKELLFFIFQVNQFTGQAFCLEGQLNMQWIEKKCLNPAEFPPANLGIFDFLPN